MLISCSLLVLAANPGCHQADQDQAGGPSTGSVASPGNRVTLETTTWRSFVLTGDRIMAGARPADAELQAFALTPAAVTWSRSVDPNGVPPLRMGNWLAAAFTDKLGDRLPGKLNQDRRALAVSYRYSYDHRAEVDSLLNRLADLQVLAQLDQKLGTWIEPKRLPRHIVLACLPAKPEIRVINDTVLIDTGVLVAGGIKQTLNQVTSLLYRTYQAPAVTNPDGLQGEESLAEALVLLRNEGMAAYLENRTETYFRPDHPTLKNVKILAQGMAYTAGRLIALADSTLPPLLADPDRMAQEGQDFPRTLTASGGYAKLGYAMAATIAGNSGTDQLRTAEKTVAGFLLAYQDAAGKNPLPSPRPGAIGYPWYASARPFDTPLVKDLLELLKRRGLP